MKKTEPIIPALSDEEVKEMMMDEYEMKLGIEEEPIESFPTTEEIKDVFTGDWDRKFNLPELTEEPITQPNNIKDMTDPNVPLPKPDENVADIPPMPEPVIERPKNTVRIMDGNFPF